MGAGFHLDGHGPPFQAGRNNDLDPGAKPHVAHRLLNGILDPAQSGESQPPDFLFDALKLIATA